MVLLKTLPCPNYKSSSEEHQESFYFLLDKQIQRKCLFINVHSVIAKFTVAGGTTFHMKPWTTQLTEEHPVCADFLLFVCGICRRLQKKPNVLYIINLKMPNVCPASAQKAECSNQNFYVATSLLSLGVIKLEEREKTHCCELLLRSTTM